MAKSAKPSSESAIHFLTGTDEAEVKREASALARDLSAAGGEFGLETIDGSVATADEAVARIADTVGALLTMPFFGGAKLVWLKNPSFLGDTVLGRSEAVQTGLEKLLATLQSGLPGGIQFLLSASEVDKRKSFYKNLLKIAQVQQFNKPDFGWNATEGDLIAWTQSRAKERGVRLETQAAEVIAARVGAEPRSVDNELEKLAIAAGQEPITAKLARQLVPATREGGIFDLSNAVAARDLPLALATAEQLLRQGEKAIGLLLAAIVPTVRNLVVVKDLIIAFNLASPSFPNQFSSALNRLPERAIRHLPRKKDGAVNAYALGIAAVHAKAFSQEELHRAFRECHAANLALITSGMPDHLLMSRLLIRILGK